MSSKPKPPKRPNFIDGYMWRAWCGHCGRALGRYDHAAQQRDIDTLHELQAAGYDAFRVLLDAWVEGRTKLRSPKAVEP